MRATIRPGAPGYELPTTPFLLSIDIAAGRLAIHGDFDRQHVERFLDAIRLLDHSPSPSWSVDVASVSFCDAGGLRGLLAAQRLAEQAGRTFQVTGAGPLSLVGLTAVQPSRILRSVS
jgi:anti-anti-sigma regulatory factor